MRDKGVANMTTEANMRLKRVAKGAVVTALVALLAFLAGGVSQGSTNAKSATQRVVLVQAQITRQQAQQTALDANSGTAVAETALEQKNGGAVYEVELSNGSDVKVDAKTSAIIGTDKADSDQSGHAEGGQVGTDAPDGQNGQVGTDAPDGQNGQDNEGSEEP